MKEKKYIFIIVLKSVCKKFQNIFTYVKKMSIKQVCREERKILMSTTVLFLYAMHRSPSAFCIYTYLYPLPLLTLDFVLNKVSADVGTTLPSNLNRLDSKATLCKP